MVPRETKKRNKVQEEKESVQEEKESVQEVEEKVSKEVKRIVSMDLRNGQCMSDYMFG